MTGGVEPPAGSWAKTGVSYDSSWRRTPSFESVVFFSKLQAVQQFSFPENPSENSGISSHVQTFSKKIKDIYGWLNPMDFPMGFFSTLGFSPWQNGENARRWHAGGPRQKTQRLLSLGTVPPGDPPCRPAGGVPMVNFPPWGFSVIFSRGSLFPMDYPIGIGIRE